MKKFLSILGVVALVAGLAMLAPDVLAQTGGTSAQGAGEGLVDAVSGIVSGNIGLAVGLSLGVFGLYLWLVQQNTWGIVVILGGVVVTAFPGVFDGISGGVDGILASLGADSGGTFGVGNRADDATGGTTTTGGGGTVRN